MRRAISSMRKLGLIEDVDEPLVTEWLTIAVDLDTMDRTSHVYPQLVRIHQEVEAKVAERIRPSDEAEGDGKPSLADSLAAMGNPED